MALRRDPANRTVERLQDSNRKTDNMTAGCLSAAVCALRKHQQPAERFLCTALKMRATEDTPAGAEQLPNAYQRFHHQVGGWDSRQPALHFHLVESPLGRGKAKLETRLEKCLEQYFDCKFVPGSSSSRLPIDQHRQQPGCATLLNSRLVKISLE